MHVYAVLLQQFDYVTVVSVFATENEARAECARLENSEISSLKLWVSKRTLGECADLAKLSRDLF